MSQNYSTIHQRPAVNRLASQSNRDNKAWNHMIHSRQKFVGFRTIHKCILQLKKQEGVGLTLSVLTPSPNVSRAWTQAWQSALPIPLFNTFCIYYYLLICKLPSHIPLRTSYRFPKMSEFHFYYISTITMENSAIVS